MAKQGAGRRGKAKAAEAAGRPVGERELIVVADPAVGLRAGGPGMALASATGADVSSIADVLSGTDIQLTPLFGSTEDRVRVASMAATAGQGPDLSRYYTVSAPDAELDDIADRLRAADGIEAAYVKPPAEPAQVALNDMVPSEDLAPPVTPDFTARQFYLDAAPGGIDARYGWTRTGGGGNDVRVIDIEGAWRFDHEDLLQNIGGVVGGIQSTDIGWRNHGTAVIGVIGGDRNTVGVTGIVPDATSSAISIFGTGQTSSRAIRDAADRLRAGDVILIELHRPGPRHNFAGRDDQLGYIAVEWWDDDFAAIAYAVSRGVIVIEAAGNGAENLDDAIYSTRPAGFPASWTNPFNRSNRDCGAVIVGAGAPPPGTHGADHGPDRSRLDFSNFGACVDVQGIGREVTTCGYGDLQGGTNENEWYTDRFSGTSSSSPIVVGAVASVQGALRAASRPLLTPATARQHLRNTGSPQQDAPGRPATQRIGRRPDVRALYAAVFPKLKEFKEGKELIKEGKEVIKDVKEKEVRKELAKEIEKLRKENVKEFKEKDKEKEFKEKDVKEFKEKEKDVFEGEVIRRENVIINPAEAAAGLEARVAGLEAAVSELAHFISAELRPDLSSSPLSGEADQSGQAEVSAALARNLEEAKTAKDNKDVEKPMER
jgi:hypothetical protein